ncbi:hypothetical protein KY329_03670 [Candidatus Woesearchaeota archaeon]|nr:hypothetical protein [Candidatus Woesearchaeota archaeon]
MKRGIILLLLLLAACAQKEVKVYQSEPLLPAAAVYAPPDYNFETNSVPNTISDPAQDAELENPRVAIVRQFIENQNSDDIYEYAEGLGRNLDITGGEMHKIVENEWEIYSERAKSTSLFFELYEKGKEVFDKDKLEKLEQMYEETYKPRLNLGVIYDRATYEYSGEKDGEAYVIVRAKEYNNIPGEYFVKDIEDTYIVAKVDGQWKVVGVKNGDERLMYASLGDTWHGLLYDNQVENKNLKGLRMVIGLSQ